MATEDKRFRITGRTVEETNPETGIGNLKVEAWDKDEKYHDLLGVAYTKRDGSFEIEFDTSYFRAFDADSKPDIFFKVYKKKKLVKSTEDKPIKEVSRQTNVQIKVRVRTFKERRASESVGIFNSKSAFNLADSYKKSDFKGVYRQYTERVKSSAGFVSNFISGALKNGATNPIKPFSANDNDFVGRDAAKIESQYQEKQVVVNRVAYKPQFGLSQINLSNFLPKNLEAGDELTIYEENGKVKGYEINKRSRRTNNQPELNYRTNVAASQDEVKTVKLELDETKKQMVAKDKEITKLKRELTKIKKEQDEIKAVLQSDEMTRFLKAMREKNDDTNKEEGWD